MKLPQLADNERNKVVWISRGHKSFAEGRGLDVVNEDEVFNKLRPALSKLGYELVVHSSPHHSFSKAIEYFAQARVIVGAHGTGLYNQWIAPDDCKVIEFQPPNYESPSIHANWLNSALIGQPYHLMHVETVPTRSPSQVQNLRFGKNALEDLSAAVLAHVVERPLKVVTKKFKPTQLLQAPPGVDVMSSTSFSPFPKLQAPLSDTELATQQAQQDLDMISELRTNDDTVVKTEAHLEKPSP